MVKSALKSLLGLSLCLMGCSGLEQSEQEQLRRLNAKGEYIYRHHDEILYPLVVPRHQVRERYPWEETLIGQNFKITKEFFRCKGSPLNPASINHKDPNRGLLFDCSGGDKHSLPLRDNKEFVYPILIDILNYLQLKTGKKVIITCGHRCPMHNAYADGSIFNQASKHMLGAEVDFYVEGLEYQPEEVLQLIFQFYRETPGYRGIKEFEQFLRFEGKTNVSRPPWYNKEILIKLFQKNEGRDFDNHHAFPYLCLQVRYDRDLDTKVTYDWKTAFNNYRRY